MDALMDALEGRGRTYESVVSGETGYHKNPDSGKKNYTERFAFLWDGSRVALKEGPEFVSSPAINNEVFRQVPIFCDFTCRTQEGFDFRVATTHTVYKKELHFVRKKEIAFLRDWVTGQAQGAEKEILVVGDFNANPPGQRRHFSREILEAHEGYRILMLESERSGEPTVRTTIERKKNADAAYKSRPVYDHILVSDQLSEELPEDPVTRRSHSLGVIAFDQSDHWKALGLSDRKTEAKLSDHRPIWFVLDYNAVDTD